jgi:hypothetical protein
MLRVTVEDPGGALRLKVEERLAAVWVRELEQSRRTLTARSPGVAVIVDLTQTSFVDLAGKYLLSLPTKAEFSLTQIRRRSTLWSRRSPVNCEPDTYL